MTTRMILRIFAAAAGMLSLFISPAFPAPHNGPAQAAGADRNVALAANTQASLPPLVSLTFDDQDQTVYDNAYPILSARGIPATFFFITSYLTTQWTAQLNDLQDHGWEIGSHSVNHPYLTGLDYTGLVEELGQSKQDLEEAGLNVTGFAYPYGAGEGWGTITEVLEQYYSYARGIDGGYNTTITDPYAIAAYMHEQGMPVSEMKDWVDTAIAQKQWLIIGMHIIDDSGDDYTISPADLEELASYLKTKIDAGELQVVTVNEGFNIYGSASPDTTPPNISSLSTTPSTTEAVIGWMTNEPASSRVDYGLTASYGSSTGEADTSPRVTAHSVTLTGLASCTTYHYRARSKDAASNEGMSADGTFTTTGCGATPPSISNLTAAPSATQAVITWTTDKAASSQVDYGLTASYGSTTSETDTSPRVTSHSVTLTGLTVCTTYHFQARSKDADSNQGISADGTFITTGCDTTPPEISNLTFTPSATQAVIGWRTNEAASSRIEYGPTASYGTSTPETDTSPRVTNHSITLTGLTACTTYHFRVHSRDAALNEGVTTDRVFTTTGCDTTPPAVSNLSAVPSTTQAVITWNTDVAASSRVDYGLTSSYGNTTEEVDISPRVASHSVTLTGLSACTTYHYRARSKDADSEEGTSADQTFTTTGCDTIPPGISGLSVAPSDTQAVVTWTTDEAAASQVDYGLTASYSSTTPETDTSPRVTSHSVTLYGLNACTTYHFRVRSKDADSNQGISADWTFTTSGCGSQIPVYIPMILNLSGAVSPTR